MNALKVIGFAFLVSACQAAPSGYGAGIGIGLGGAVTTHQAAVVDPARTAVVERVHAGPAVARTHVQHGVVGSRTVQVGSQPVQVGHRYNVVGTSVNPRPGYTVSNNDAFTTSNTVPLPAPAIPAVIGPAPIPGPLRNLGPAPADTVTQLQILAPTRTHTVITPRVTNIQPELHVNRVPVDAPYTVPVPVQRDVLVTQNVHRPVPVDAPYTVPVPQPYVVNPVRDVVQTPVIRQHTTSVHGTSVVEPGIAGHGIGFSRAGIAGAGLGLAHHGGYGH